LIGRRRVPLASSDYRASPCVAMAAKAQFLELRVSDKRTLRGSAKGQPAKGSRRAYLVGIASISRTPKCSRAGPRSARSGLRVAAALTDSKVAQVDPNIRPTEIGTAIGTSRVGSPFGGEPKPIELCDVVDILSREKAAGDIHLVVMAAQQKDRSEVKVPDRAVAGQLGRELRSQYTPAFSLLPPGSDFFDFETRHP
jgi:hypothetical protein